MDNMGTPGHPEGVDHWAIKTQVARKLQRSLEATPRAYGEPLPFELRNVKVGIDEPPGVVQALQDIVDRPWQMPGNAEHCSRPGWACVLYREPQHEGCEGGLAVVNILRGLRGGRVLVEEPYRGYQPDITLYGKDCQEPSMFLEVVATSQPSPQKLAAFKRWGIPAYRIEAEVGNISCEPMQACVLEAPCRATWRAEAMKLKNHMDRSPAFIGLKNWPTKAQAYIFGEHDPYADCQVRYGEPEVYGFSNVGPQPFSLIKPVTERAISQDLFLTYLVLQAHWALLVHEGGVAEEVRRRIAELLSMVAPQ